MSKENKSKGNKRFEVIRDNKTGVLYMSLSSGFGSAMTLLVDRDGKPLVDNEF